MVSLALYFESSSITGFNHQESHPDVNKDPKASEEFHRVKMAYDQLRSIYEEDDVLKQSHEDCERRGEEGRQGRGHSFKSRVNIKYFRCATSFLEVSQYFVYIQCCTFSQGFKSWSKDDWMNKVSEEGRKRQQYYSEENKYKNCLKLFVLV